MSKGFDPAEHLTKQGWKGKGTALKTGGLSRPLAVIQKKTLSGVGKDRDEAVPFWDQIFAATAASLSLPSSTASTPPPLSSLSDPKPKLVDPRTNKSGSWQTSGSNSGQPRGGQSGLSVGVRISRDIARRGLYSRFFKGQDVEEEDLEESEAKVEVVAGPSRLSPVKVELGDKVKVELENEEMKTEERIESKEDRRIRRAAKAKRKEEKEARRALKAVGKRVKVEIDDDVKGLDLDPADGADVVVPLDGSSRKIKKKKRNRAEMDNPDTANIVGEVKVEEGVIDQANRKKKKRKGE